jgi:hypothetical protein
MMTLLFFPHELLSRFAALFRLPFPPAPLPQAGEGWREAPGEGRKAEEAFLRFPRA